MNNSVQGLVEIYGLWYYPWWHSQWFYVAIIVMLVVCLIGIFLWYFRRAKVLTPEQKALQELHRLRSASYASPESLHAAYFTLTSIFKNYIFETTKISIFDKSDKEIIAHLDGVFAQDVLQLLQEFFERSFQIKFAYDVVSQQMLFDDIDFLQAIIVRHSQSVDVTRKS